MYGLRLALGESYRALNEDTQGRSGIGAQTGVLEPGRRYRALNIVVGKLPVLQRFLSRMPGEIGTPIIDKGGKTNQPNGFVEQHQAELVQLQEGFLQGTIGTR